MSLTDLQASSATTPDRRRLESRAEILMFIFKVSFLIFRLAVKNIFDIFLWEVRPIDSHSLTRENRHVL